MQLLLTFPNSLVMEGRVPERNRDQFDHNLNLSGESYFELHMTA